ncbi:MAG TPA: DUF3601 domain-containing protein [Chroococcales cyanobacterium]
MKEIEPSFGYDLAGYVYMGRGPGGAGWGRGGDLAYRCAACGDLMPADCNDYFDCRCKSMHLDIDAGRFGSNHGDQNILRYRKATAEEFGALTALTPGSSIEVIRDFKDFDGHTHRVGSPFNRFKEYNFVPYHGGYTFYFENGTLRLCDNEPANCDVLFKAGQFFRYVGASVDLLIRDDYNKHGDFRVRYFRNTKNRFFYRQERFRFSRQTNRLEWSSCFADSPEFDSLEGAEADARAKVTEPDTRRRASAKNGSIFEWLSSLFGKL